MRCSDSESTAHVLNQPLQSTIVGVGVVVVVGWASGRAGRQDEAVDESRRRMSPHTFDPARQASRVLGSTPERRQLVAAADSIRAEPSRDARRQQHGALCVGARAAISTTTFAAESRHQQTVSRRPAGRTSGRADVWHDLKINTNLQLVDVDATFASRYCRDDYLRWQLVVEHTTIVDVTHLAPVRHPSPLVTRLDASHSLRARSPLHGRKRRFSAPTD